MNSRIIPVAWIAVVLALVSQTASAQAPAGAWQPTRNVTWNVPYAPGGGYDAYSRKIAEVLTRKYMPKGTQVLVQNTPGAGARVGLLNVYKAKPDGHTIGILEPFGVMVFQALEGTEKSGYDVGRIVWLGNVNVEPYVLAVSAKSPFRSLKDLQNATVVRWASEGTGTGSYVTSVMFAEKARVKISFVTGYGGSAEAAMGAGRGDADAVVYPMAALQPFFQKGILVPIASLGTERFSAMPELPTLKEQGHDVVSLILWAVYGPPDLPAAAVRYWDATLQQVLKDAELLEWSASTKRAINPTDAQGTKKLMQGLEVSVKAAVPLLPKYVK